MCCRLLFPPESAFNGVLLRSSYSPREAIACPDMRVHTKNPKRLRPHKNTALNGKKGKEIVVFIPSQTLGRTGGSARAADVSLPG